MSFWISLCRAVARLMQVWSFSADRDVPPEAQRTGFQLRMIGVIVLIAGSALHDLSDLVCVESRVVPPHLWPRWAAMWTDSPHQRWDLQSGWSCTKSTLGLYTCFQQTQKMQQYLKRTPGRYKTRCRLDVCEPAARVALSNLSLVCMSLCWRWPLGDELWEVKNAKSACW